MLIQQYEDLQDEYDIAIQEIKLAANLNMANGNAQSSLDIVMQLRQVSEKYNVRFNRLN